MPDNILSPKRIAAEPFTNAAAAVARLAEIYERNVSFLRTAFEAYVRGEPLDRWIRKTWSSREAPIELPVNAASGTSIAPAAKSPRNDQLRGDSHTVAGPGIGSTIAGPGPVRERREDPITAPAP